MVDTADHRGQPRRRSWSGMKLTPVLALTYMDYMDYLYIKRHREENVEVYRHGRSYRPGRPGGTTNTLNLSDIHPSTLRAKSYSDTSTIG